jgi:glycosyltransferase involved in cell wall biosynthesis
MTQTDPMRVMYVVPDLAVGGAERHVTTLMPNLDRTRFYTEVVCVGAEGGLFGDLIRAGSRAKALHRSKRQALHAISDLVGEMRRFAPDVVITRGYSAETLGRIAAALARVPHNVVWVHNHGDVTPRGSVRRIADRVLDRFTSAYFGVAQAQSDYMVDELHCPADKVRIIYNGVDPQRFDPATDRRVLAEFGIAPSDKVVGILAALRPEKDHSTFLRAARLVIDQMPSAKFLIVGEGETRPAIEREVADLGLGSCVTVAGRREDVADILRAMDVFVLCSYSVECFPMALLEAMAAGRPAVSTAVGGVPEMIEEGVTGFLVPPRDPKALADSLLKVLTDDDLACRMGRAARTRVEEKFNLRASILATERALTDVVGHRVEDTRSSRHRFARLTETIGDSA